MKRFAWAAVALALAVGSVLAGIGAWPAASFVLRTEDRNGDGRPDVWRLTDRNGLTVEVSIDSNFDGRSDIQQHYERGALVREERDRNFDDRVDLVEEFDAATREILRSVVDTDLDGSADLLVLYQAGRPVFSESRRQAGGQVRAAAPVTRSAADALAPLADPFDGDTAVRPAGASARGWLTAVGFPVGVPAVAAPDVRRARAVSTRVSALDAVSIADTSSGPRSPRAPPLA